MFVSIKNKMSTLTSIQAWRQTGDKSYNFKQNSYPVSKNASRLCDISTGILENYVHCASLFVPIWYQPYHIRFTHVSSLIARSMEPTWGPSGADRAQVGPMLGPWALLSGVGRIWSLAGRPPEEEKAQWWWVRNTTSWYLITNNQ